VLHLLIVPPFGQYTIQAKIGVGRLRDDVVGGSSRLRGLRLYRIHHLLELGQYRASQRGRLRQYGRVVVDLFGRS
jgi:hypothetical protein